MAAVSVIIPVYNTPISYFRECMQSILVQDFTDYEVWLVDDGSTNGVEKLCDDYAQKDERFKVVHQKNQGVSAARNAGILHALESSSEYLMFLDPDDWWDKETLFSLYKKVKDENLDVVIFSIYYEFLDRKEKRLCFSEKSEEYFFRPSEEIVERMQLDLLSGHNRADTDVPACQPSANTQLISKSLIRKQSLMFDEEVRMSEDRLYSLKLWNEAKYIGVWNMPFYHYRQHKGSACHKYNPEMTKHFEYAGKATLEFIKQSKDSAAFFRAYDNWLLGTYILCFQNINSPNNPQSRRERAKEWRNIPIEYPLFQRLYGMKLKRKQLIKRIMFFACFKLRSYTLMKAIVCLTYKGA